MMFSATFPPEIQKLAAEFLRPYVWIAVGRVGSTTESITQVLVKATPDKRKKLQLVVQALQSGPDGRTLIFVQKKKTATWLKKQLNKGGPDDGKPNERFTPIAATDIHGDRSQAQREAALEAFRSGKCRVLVATDVAGKAVKHVCVCVFSLECCFANMLASNVLQLAGWTFRAWSTSLIWICRLRKKSLIPIRIVLEEREELDIREMQRVCLFLVKTPRRAMERLHLS